MPTQHRLPEAPIASTPATQAGLVDAMRRAIAIGETYAGATAPNPAVGCTILDAAGEVLACEGHRRAGAAHAEAAAIAACQRAGVLDRIHTVVVTLEPCNHHGRTPPCVDAILSTPAKAVWYGVLDPNPGVSGGGAGRLAAHGLDVRPFDQLDDPAAPEMGAAARRLIAPFALWCRTGRPWLTVKQAIAADGGMIPAPGHKTFTSASSLVLAHRLRRRADAIITGSGTILADDPAFTVRLVQDHDGKRRRLAILDRRGRTPPAYIAAATARGFDVSLHADIDTALSDLGKAGVIEALVEAGPTLHGAFVGSGRWDEQVIIRQSPIPDAPDTIDQFTRQPI